MDIHEKKAAIEFAKLLDSLLNDMLEEIPEGKDKSNGQLMMLLMDTSDQLLRLSRMAANCEIEHETANEMLAYFAEVKTKIDAYLARVQGASNDESHS